VEVAFPLQVLIAFAGPKSSRSRSRSKKEWREKFLPSTCDVDERGSKLCTYRVLTGDFENSVAQEMNWRLIIVV